MPIPKAFVSYFHFATNSHFATFTYTNLSRSGVPGVLF